MKKLKNIIKKLFFFLEERKRKAERFRKMEAGISACFNRMEKSGLKKFAR